MKLGLITLSSSLHDPESIERAHVDLISGLKREYPVSFIKPEESSTVDLSLVFIASGGSEGMFVDIHPRLSKPVILLADGMHNSLAASLEIMSWLRKMGEDVELLHGSLAAIVGRVGILYRLTHAKTLVSRSLLGQIGFPSEWLIGSSVDPVAVRRRWGLTIKHIELDEVYAALDDVSARDAEETGRGFLRRSASVREANPSDINDAARVYHALKTVCKREKLDAMTLKCFDLLVKRKTTGCLALSLLNDEKIISGCEGDVPAAISMLVLSLLTGQAPFMANPSNVDAESNEVIFAHCTIATSMTESFHVRTHFESGMGIGIQGIMKEDSVTVFKCGGSDMGAYFVSRGELLENMDDPCRCRTQIRIQMEEDVAYFLKNPLANHHVIVQGDHVDLISEFMAMMKCARVSG